MSGVQLSDKEYKEVVKKLLFHLDELCRKYNVKYFVCYGSLIGIIRHGGFIPWDDDIDVCMLREDYELFVQEFSKEKDDRYYILSSTSNESKSYYNGFTRFCDRSVICTIDGTFDIENFGAFIDIFPLDNVPDSKEERLQFYKEYKAAFSNVLYSLPLRCYKTLPAKRALKYTLFLPKRIPCVLKGINKMRQIRDNIKTRYNKEPSRYVCNLFDIPSDKFLLAREDLSELTRAYFEDIEVNVPVKADKILRGYYGDYMQLPPENERYSKHHFTPYWRDYFGSITENKEI